MRVRAVDAPVDEQRRQVIVQAVLLGAGSLDAEIVKLLRSRPMANRFLVDCVEAAEPRIPESQTDLRRSMADFCYQERRHNANHVKFNKAVEYGVAT